MHHQKASSGPVGDNFLLNFRFLGILTHFRQFNDDSHARIFLKTISILLLLGQIRAFNLPWPCICVCIAPLGDRSSIWHNHMGMQIQGDSLILTVLIPSVSRWYLSRHGMKRSKERWPRNHSGPGAIHPHLVYTCRCRRA